MSDDDDGPVFFKRNSALRKESQLEATRKQQFLKNRIGADSAGIKNRSTTTSPSPSSNRSQITTVESSNSSSVILPLAPVDISAGLKQKAYNLKANTKEENCLGKPLDEKGCISEDSDDEKPLIHRRSSVKGGLKNSNDRDDVMLPLPPVDMFAGWEPKAYHQKANTSSVKEENSLCKPLDEKGCISEDSEDEKPLIRRRSSVVAKRDLKNSNDRDDKIKHNDVDDDKPLTSTFANLSGKGGSKIPIKNPMSSASPTEKNVCVAKQSAEELFQMKKSPPEMKKDETGTVKNSCKRTIHDISPPEKPEYNGKTELSYESEDEMPIWKRFQMKSSAEASTSSPCESKMIKSISSSSHQNGSLQRGNTFKKSSNGSNKRPSGEIYRSSSVKRTKIPPDIPNTKSKIVSTKEEPDDEDDLPISHRMKKPTIPDNKLSTVKKIVNKGVSSPLKHGSIQKKSKFFSKYSESSSQLPSSEEGQKWTTLEHNGVIFPPPYKSHGIKMLYDGKPVDLSIDQEEVATMFAVMKDTDYATKPRFIENFMTDWKKKLGANHVIKDFSLCDFTPIYEWHQKEKELKKQMTSEEKNALKDEKLKNEEKYMWAVVDGVKEKVGNFRVEPPGLFRGRGEHPKMGKLKRRIRPSDITINIGKDAPIPECHIPGERWKEIKHDNTVTWLAFWNDPIASKEFKYVFLAPSSSLKGQSDREKYEKARLLKNYIHDIRTAYTNGFKSSDVTRQQIAVATYLIDKLALRAGNEKDDDEADTVGCCTLKVENVKPIPPNILQFDFLGKDSIRYENQVEVELLVYAAIVKFRVGKDGGDDLFDKLDTAKLNAHLKELMPGLTAKVFRTYNASSTLDGMLHSDTKDGFLEEKLKVYQHANKQVAIICNHQRTISKSHDTQMSRMTDKIDELKAGLAELKNDLSMTKRGKASLKEDEDGKQKRNMTPEMIEKKMEQLNIKIEKMELSKQIKEDLKTVALGTSKVSYLDPRITVAWCKRHEVKIEKIFNKSLLAKFAWAMDVSPGFRF